MKKRGIFIKVFTYTAIFLALLVCVTVGLFSQQFVSFYNTTQIQQLNSSYQNLYAQLHGKSAPEALALARSFYESNQSFSFYIAAKDDPGNVIYSTPNIDPVEVPDSAGNKIIMTVGQDFILCATSHRANGNGYGDLATRISLALASMLLIGLVGAFIFARQMTKPIKRLADDTKKMADCEDVPPAPERSDELGELARGVHAMYDKLIDTISKLEEEILREREMEETQRYFFSSASHELKTPIAAASVLLEGMLENVGDFKDHPRYLRECIRLMDSQGKMISEILEIVNLNDGKITPAPTKLGLGQTVAELLPSLRTLAEANGKRINVDISEDRNCIADKRMLAKALSNVILNAVQNTPEGGEIRIWSEGIADQHRLFVLNTGARIGKDILPKLFDPFYRIDKARSRKDSRSGLGLTIVQKTLEAMGVEFALANSDEGVLFWLDLPEI